MVQKDLEYSYLCACIYDKGCLGLFNASGLGPELFTLNTSLVVLKALESIDGPIDLTTIAATVSQEGGDLSELAELSTAASTTAHAVDHFRLLKERFFRRKIKNEAASFYHLLHDEGGDNMLLPDLQSNVEALCKRMSFDGLEEVQRSQDEIAQSVIDERLRIIDGQQSINTKKIYTGVHLIDRYLRPLDVATGDYNCILFAATSTGKSSLASQIILHNIFSGMKVAVFLGETDHFGLLAQMAGQKTKVSIDPYEFKNEPKDRQEEFITALRQIKSLHTEHLRVYDDKFYVEDVIRRSKAAQRDLGGLDLIVIDHLHVLKSRKKHESERVRYNYMSSELKPLGIDLACPILTLAQPSREFKYGTRPPLLSDLKESGSLEDDADRIWALYLPSEDKEGIPQDRTHSHPEIQLHQLKFRKGQCGMVRLRLHKQYTLFHDTD